MSSTESSTESSTSLSEAVDAALDRYNMKRSDEAARLGRLVADLQD